MNGNLKKFYESIPRYDNEYLKKRNEIIEKCGISVAIWQNWKEGKTIVPKPCKEIIAKVFEVEVETIFPNENQ